MTVNIGKLKTLGPKKDSGVDQTEFVVMDMGDVEPQKKSLQVLCGCTNV